jgi:hypothetical protein
MKQLKLIIFAFLINISLVSNAQINIQFNTINEYLFNTKQTLNFSAINPNPKSLEVYFVGKIKDSRNEMVVEFKTQSVILNSGVNMFNPMNLSINDINYFNYDILEIEEKSGTYPYGQYLICLYSICSTSDCSGLSSGAGSVETPICISVNIENPTPLILTHPENESEIEETRPLYTWIPPSPVASSSNLNYTMRLVELLDGQTKADALSMNRPLIEMSGIERPALMHPFDIPELEKGKWYAWQVTAYVGQTEIAKSEQWKFKIKKEEEKIEKPTFVLLKKDNHVIYNVRKTLNFTYIENKVAGILNLEILDLESKSIYKNIDTYKAERGENSYSIEIKDLNLHSNKVYTLVVKNKYNETYVLKFIVI